MKLPPRPKCKAKGDIGKARWRNWFEARDRWRKAEAKRLGVPVSRLIARELEWNA